MQTYGRITMRSPNRWRSIFSGYLKASRIPPIRLSRGKELNQDLSKTSVLFWKKKKNHLKTHFMFLAFKLGWIFGICIYLSCFNFSFLLLFYSLLAVKSVLRSVQVKLGHRACFVVSFFFFLMIWFDLTSNNTQGKNKRKHFCVGRQKAFQFYEVTPAAKHLLHFMTSSLVPRFQLSGKGKSPQNVLKCKAGLLLFGFREKKYSLL